MLLTITPRHYNCMINLTTECHREIVYFLLILPPDEIQKMPNRVQEINRREATSRQNFPTSIPIKRNLYAMKRIVVYENLVTSGFVLPFLFVFFPRVSTILPSATLLSAFYLSFFSPSRSVVFLHFTSESCRGKSSSVKRFRRIASSFFPSGTHPQSLLL